MQFRQARHFTQANRKTVDLIVIHSAEVGETAEIAEQLMERCAVTDRKASWHYAVDADSVTMSVKEEDVAWHAPGANKNGIGIELCGRASQSADDWADNYSSRVVARAAKVCAAICTKWNIPAKFVPADALLRGQRGITTHAEVSKAFKKSNHTDPGPSFPMERLIEMTRHYRVA
jgi:N-acetyl-anhydromuramyl-L-alanine amidase AmpD